MQKFMIGDCSMLFQSLIGRLKTVADSSAAAGGRHRFQSLIGRLKTCEQVLERVERALVSIPHR